MVHWLLVYDGEEQTNLVFDQDKIKYFGVLENTNLSM
jgi:hypothetical protein